MLIVCMATMFLCNSLTAILGLLMASLTVFRTVRGDNMHLQTFHMFYTFLLLPYSVLWYVYVFLYPIPDL